MLTLRSIVFVILFPCCDCDVTVVGVTWAGARKPPRARRRVARCVSPYSTDSNYEPAADLPRRRPPQRRRHQPRHQHAPPAASASAVATPHAAAASTGETQPSPAANSARPRPPPIAAKPRRKFNHAVLIGEFVHGGPKKPDCFRALIALRRSAAERRVIRRTF